MELKRRKLFLFNHFITRLHSQVCTAILRFFREITDRCLALEEKKDAVYLNGPDDKRISYFDKDLHDERIFLFLWCNIFIFFNFLLYLKVNKVYINLL